MKLSIALQPGFISFVFQTVIVTMVQMDITHLVLTVALEFLDLVMSCASLSWPPGLWKMQAPLATSLLQWWTAHLWGILSKKFQCRIYPVSHSFSMLVIYVRCTSQHTGALYWYSKSVRPSVCLSDRHVPVFYQNGFNIISSPHYSLDILVLWASNSFSKIRRGSPLSGIYR